MKGTSEMSVFNDNGVWKNRWNEKKITCRLHFQDNLGWSVNDTDYSGTKNNYFTETIPIHSFLYSIKL